MKQADLLGQSCIFITCSALSLTRPAQAERDTFHVRVVGVHRFIRHYHVKNYSHRHQHCLHRFLFSEFLTIKTAQTLRITRLTLNTNVQYKNNYGVLESLTLSGNLHRALNRLRGHLETNYTET